MVSSIHRSTGLFPALLLGAGLVTLQILIGGTVLVFCFPGICLIGAATLLAVATSARPRTKTNSLCLCATAIFFGYILVRAWQSPAYIARLDLFSVVGALAVYGLTATMTSTRARAAIVASLLGLAVVEVLIGLLQFSRGDNFMLIPFLQRADYGPRASGFLVCPNHLAGFLEAVGIFGLSLICWSRWPLWSKLLVAYATGACYVGIILTGSRGGGLSALASLLAFGLVSLVVLRRKRVGSWWKFGLIGLVALSMLAGTAGFFIQRNGYLKQRAGNVLETNNIRVELWRAALKQWELDPAFGTGAGTYRFYGRQFRTEQMQADPIHVHNDYLHLLCEYGLVGLAGFLLFFSVHLRQGWRSLSRSASGGGALLSNRRALTIGALAAIAAYVVHSAFDFNLHIPANAILLAFVFGLLANPDIAHRSDTPPSTWAIFPRIVTAALGAILLVQSARLFPGEYYGERARAALRDEDPVASIRLAHQALEYEKANPDLFFYLGRASNAAAHQPEQAEQAPALHKQAIAAYQEAQRLAPLDGTYPLDLAFTYDEVGRFPEAEVMYAAARTRDPRSINVQRLYQVHLNLLERGAPAAMP